MKICTICGEKKDLSEYHKNKKGSKGRDSRCKDCKNKAKRDRDASAEGRHKNKSYISSDSYREKRTSRRWSGDFGFRKVESEISRRECKDIASFKYVSRVEAKELGLTRYFEGTECKRGHISERSAANNQCMGCCEDKRKTESYRRGKSEYYKKNKDWLMTNNVRRQRERYSENPNYKCSVAARNMLKRILKSTGNQKNNKSVKILGYSPHELRSHIELLWLDGMSWENYGEWHIDHIKPVSLMISEGVSDPSIINALSNLQPLWAEDNFKKRDSFVQT